MLLESLNLKQNMQRKDKSLVFFNFDFESFHSGLIKRDLFAIFYF